MQGSAVFHHAIVRSPLFLSFPAWSSPKSHSRLVDNVRCRSAPGKGFGKSKSAKKEEEEAKSSKRVKVRRRNVAPPTTLLEKKARDQSLALMDVRSAESVEEAMRKKAEEEEFQQRLSALKTAAPDKPEARVPSPSSSPLASLDQGEGSDIYANPPPLMQTFLSQMNEEISDPKLKKEQFGPSQFALAGGAILFALIFLLVSGADFQTNKRFKGLSTTLTPPDPIETGVLRGKAAALEGELATRPDDPELLEALATTETKMLNLEKAADLLERLAKQRTDDPEVWRVLGEVTLLSEQSARSVKAYEKALELNKEDRVIWTGMVNAYIANGEYQKAIQALEPIRKEYATRTTVLPPASLPAPSSSSRSSNPSQPSEAPLVQSSPAESNAGAESLTETPSGSNADGTLTEGASTASSTVAVADSLASVLPVGDGEEEEAGQVSSSAGDTGSVASSSSTSAAGSSRVAASQLAPDRPLDPVIVELLAGKVYSSWRGHDNDALATYDAITKRFPEDYRGYLARGTFLKERGRRADAERMFMQARFYAPEEQRGTVQRLSESNPILDLPEND